MKWKDKTREISANRESKYVESDCFVCAKITNCEEVMKTSHNNYYINAILTTFQNKGLNMMAIIAIKKLVS